MQNKESMSHVNMKYDLLFFILIINVIRNKYSSSNKLKINDKRVVLVFLSPVSTGRLQTAYLHFLCSVSKY